MQPGQFEKSWLLEGPQLFAHYAFMPNRLAYCGGSNDSQALFDYVVAGESDPGLVLMLRKFSGALPYMRLIARSNRIPDPFDRRVVEAYWLGNSLLEGVEAHALHENLRLRYARHLSPATLNLILGKAPAGARPHHSFHVLEVCPRNGWPHSLDFMDNCRISWGQVATVDGGFLSTDVVPLILKGNNLELGLPVRKVIARQIDGQGFIDGVQPGDWISIHWGWACQVLTQTQRTELEKWTRYHLKFANQTL